MAVPLLRRTTRRPESGGNTVNHTLRIAPALLLALTLTLFAHGTNAAGEDVHFAPADAPAHEHPDGLGAAARVGGPDSDGDGQDDYEDNCRDVANPDQRDTDQDGYGNVCDADLNNDGLVNAVDLGQLRAAFFSMPGTPGWNPDADFNGDGVVNAIDLGALRARFFQPPGPSGMACAGSAPCPGTLRFLWPMPGDDADEWVINNYVDLDPGGAILDYAGGAKSYDGHRGIDIDVPTFRAMDNDFPILAVELGTVLALDDSHFDRNTSCSGDWNFVTIGHANGYKTIYGHLKQNSVVVNVGDIVQPGDVLGVVGSSGCSTAPHLHLETHDADGNVVEPFQAGLWAVPPVYDTPIGFMDAVLYNTAITHVDMIKDPAANVTLVAPGSTFGMGISMGGGGPGDSVNLRILDETNAIVAQTTINWPGVLRHSYWWWNYNFAAGASGEHRFQVRVNNVLKATYYFDVEEILTGFMQVRHHVPAGSYQALFDQMTANGYRLRWIDGYKVGNSTFFNVIFDQSNVASWSAAHGLTSAQYQTYFDQQTAAGRRLVHVDSYRQGSATRYAAIFVQQIGTFWAAYHGVTGATHQANFNSLVAQGYRAAVISVVQDSGGTLRYTALYDKNAVGGWVALAGLTSAQYQAEFTSQANAGRTLKYLNGYTVNGSPRFTAIWDSLVPGSWVGQHNLTSPQFQNAFDNWTGLGLTTRLVTGYDNGAGVPLFGGLWSN